MTSKILAFGDLHAGKGRALYPGRLAEQSDVLDRILTLGRERNVDVILGLGDTFDRRRPDVPEMLAVETPLVRHRAAGGPPVHLLVGNHEVGGVDDVTPVDVLAEAGLVVGWRHVGVMDFAGVRVGFLPWTPVARLVAARGGGDRDNVFLDAADLLVRIAAGLRDGGADLLVGHWSMSGSSLPSGMPVDQLRETVIPREPLEQLGFAYAAFAHIHRPGHFGDGTCLYVGSPMPLDHSEATTEHGCWIIDMHARETEFVPLESHHFVTINRDEIDDLHDHLTESRHGYVVRVKDTIGGSDDFDYAGVRATLLAAGAKRVDFAITVERAARPDREPVLDTDREPSELLAAWLDQEGVEDSERLVELARGYLGASQAVVA